MLILKCTLDLQPFWTVITGVVVFVLSQLFIEFFLRPIQEYKKLKSDISWALTYYANIYSNPTGVKQELYNEASTALRKLAAELRAFNIRKPKILYKKETLEAASKHLIGLSNCMGHDTNRAYIQEDVKRIKEALGILNEEDK